MGSRANRGVVGRGAGCVGGGGGLSRLYVIQKVGKGGVRV